MYLKFFIFVLAVVLIYVTIYSSISKSGHPKKFAKVFTTKIPSEIVICTVVCGIDRTEEAIVMIKSALIFSAPSDRLKFVIVTELPLFEWFEGKLETFDNNFPNFKFSLVEVKFPSDDWRNLFKPCASQRLFLPSLLKHDHILYVDSDTIFLSPPRDTFHHFHRFNSSQIAALTTESESENIGWYSRFAMHPYYGLFGVNSGVMLMDLAKMRHNHWEHNAALIYREHNLSLVFGDQDIINIYFHFHPQELFLLPCEFNYRPDHCMYTPLCNAYDGIKIIHGSRGYFHNPESQPIFSQIYDAIQKQRLDTDACHNFISDIEFQVKSSNSSACSQLSEKFLKIPKMIMRKCDMD